MKLAGATAWPDAFAERYRAAGYWTGEPFGAVLRATAARHGDALAVIAGTERWTYADLDTRADRLAAGLFELGVRPRDRVVVQLPNIAEFAVVCFALFRLDAIPVFALPAHRSSELTHFATVTEATTLITVDRHARYDHSALAAQVRDTVESLEHIVVVGEPGPRTGQAALVDLYREPRDLPDPDPSDVALLQVSGGSTGLPKLIPRTHDDYLYSVRESVRICGLGPDSVYLALLPVAHNFPLSSPGLLGVIAAGARAVLAAHPSPDVAFPLVAEHGVTITAMVPPLVGAWLDAAATTAHDLSSLRLIQVGGAKLPEPLARRVRPELGACLQQVFGMAEGLVNYTRLDDSDEVVVATQGRPISPDDEVRIVDDMDVDVEPGRPGHLLTRGPYTIRGYYRAEEHNRRAFTADGFYRTGDIVRRTPEGHLVVEGRAKDQINRGGEKIAVEEVENHLLAHPGIRDAVVVAMPDAYLGERTCAFVVPRGADTGADTGAAPPRGPELRAFLRSRGLADYKIPDRFEAVEQFPHTAVGKISRSELRAALTRRLAAGADPPAPTRRL